VVDTLILKGPSAYDGVVTYESVVVRELEDFEDRWGPAQLVYPAVNIWNETTYFILETPRSTTRSRRVSEDFLQFLLSEPAQRQLVRSGFRPANPHVKIHFEGSPFTTLQNRGGDHEIPIAIEPSREALAALHEVAATIR
jgi:ABC-type sulfate transport system substrate-binding protein